MSPSHLHEFSACEISDALIKMGIQHGGYIPDINLIAPSPETKIYGPAYTVKMVHGSDTSTPKVSFHFVDRVPPGSIIVIDAPSQTKNAVWGGLMSAGAQAQDAAGVIISGRCRDLAEHRALGFPVFARGHSTLGQSPFTRVSEINVPLTIAPEGAGDFPSVTILPGDWMLADENGVVSVPRSLESQVIEIAAKGRAIDEKCMEDIKAGKGVQASFKTHRGN
ncbi:ribonuclease E inhibitor RraA/Dimethylmenaquinone methyltransferase [Infundibulicybe gibba]|nr:ribonuclease E inhibitor RraA/Dimethylmenaquinone methyltransferase [Infundibulicybe gibba]